MAQVKEEPRGPCGSWGPAQEHTHTEAVEPGPRLKEEEPELSIKQEPQEFPFHMVTVKSEDDEDKSSVLHQRPTEEKREETNVWECGAEAGCSSDPLTQFHSDSEEHTDSSEDTDHSQDYSQEQAPAKRRSYAMVPPDSAHLRDARPHRCPECGRSFRFKSNLKRHSLSHSEENVHKCSVCGKTFKWNSRLQMHMLRHTGQRPHKCSVCEKAFTDKQSLVTHLRSKHHMCTVCEVCFEDDVNLKEHLKTHGEDWNLELFSCSECGKSFRWNSRFQEHMLRHTGERPHKCPVCEKAFIEKGGLTKHLRLQHHMCRVCEVCFPDDVNLKEHLKSHVEEGTADQSVLKTHNCTECGRSFSWKSHLQKHMLSHSEEKPHKCPECGKNFSWRSQLQKHMFSHTIEKPHKCSVCEKRFRVKVSLAFHLRTVHHMCTVCEVCFEDDVNLKEHLKTHGEDWNLELFSCSECGKEFPKKSNLTIHTYVHWTERPHKCSVCEKRFKLKSDLKFHQRLCHNHASGE